MYKLQSLRIIFIALLYEANTLFPQKKESPKIDGSF